jgi:non-ribosomal peptide synthetase component F
MTYRIGGHVFFGMRLSAALAVAMLALLVAGCASSTGDRAAPAGARGPVNTGTFPNLNIPPQQAAEQMTQAEKDAKMASLTAAHQQNAATAALPSDQTDPALLRKLAQTHAAEALKEIEK